MITIPNELLQNATPEAVMLYATICVYAKYAVTDDKIIMPREKLQYDMYGKDCKSTFVVNKITQRMSELEKFSVLTYDKDAKLVCINKDAFWPEKYVAIFPEEFEKFKNIDGDGYFKWLLFFYYCNIIRSLNPYINVDGKSNIIGFMPQSYFAELTDLSVATLQKYNRKLKEAELLYIVKGNRKNNMYCRYEDRLLLTKYLTK